MPIVRANEIDIYYEEHGSGEPLLLVMGWGGNAESWKPQIPGLAEHFRVIVFDTRGVGRTSAPAGPYRIPEMASDAIGLLDALQVAKAHVFGISMGGMIAQEMALARPERIETLVMGCTSPGGKQAPGFKKLQADIADFEDEMSSGGPDLEWFSEFLKHLWTDEALAKADPHLQDFIFGLIRYPPTPHGLVAQAAAISAHDTYSRLPRIRQPTLVITGSEDTLIEPANSNTLAERIPRAELRIFKGLKHAFHLERPDLVNPVIIEFIQKVRQASGHTPRIAV